jgi:hypothetical protein
VGRARSPLAHPSEAALLSDLRAVFASQRGALAAGGFTPCSPDWRQGKIHTEGDAGTARSGVVDNYRAMIAAS